jgi:hypothetical protein
MRLIRSNSAVRILVLPVPQRRICTRRGAYSDRPRGTVRGIRLFWGVALAAVFQPIGGIDIIIGRTPLCSAA